MSESGNDHTRLLRRIDRERRARKELEAVVEKRSRDLWETNEKLEHTLENLEHLVDERTFELKREIESRHKAESRLRLILNSTTEGIIGIEPSGNISFINKAALRILQYPSSDPYTCEGKPFDGVFQLVTKDGEPLADNLLYSTWHAHKQISSSDKYLKLRDGSCIAIEYSMKHAVTDEVFQGAVLTFSDISARRNLEEQIWKQANFDSLTGVPNRYLLKDRMQEAISQTSRTGKKIGLLYIDLNDFKPINDELGHAAGDFVLKVTVERLSQVIRDSDFVARVGGDEFVIVLTNLESAEYLENLKIQIKQAVSKPIPIKDQTRVVGIAAGSALFPDNGSTLEDLMKHADRHMYSDKSQTR